MNITLIKELNRINEIIGNNKFLISEDIVPKGLASFLGSDWIKSTRKAIRNADGTVTPPTLKKTKLKSGETKVKFYNSKGVEIPELEITMNPTILKNVDDWINGKVAYESLGDPSKSAIWDLIDATVAAKGIEQDYVYKKWVESMINPTGIKGRKLKGKDESTILSNIEERRINQETKEKISVYQFLTDDISKGGAGVDEQLAKRLVPHIETRMVWKKQGDLSIDPITGLAKWKLSKELQDFLDPSSYSKLEVDEIKALAKGRDLIEKGVDEVVDLTEKAKSLMRQLQAGNLPASGPDSVAEVEEALVQTISRIQGLKAEVTQQFDQFVNDMGKSNNPVLKETSEMLADLKKRRFGDTWETLKELENRKSWIFKFGKAAKAALWTRDFFRTESLLLEPIKSIPKGIGYFIKLIKQSAGNWIPQITTDIKSKIPSLNKFLNSQLTGSSRGVPATGWGILGRRPGKGVEIELPDGTKKMVSADPYADMAKLGKGWATGSYVLEQVGQIIKWKLYEAAISTIFPMLYFKMYGDERKTLPGGGTNGQCYDELAKYFFEKDVNTYNEIMHYFNTPELSKNLPKCAFELSKIERKSGIALRLDYMITNNAWRTMEAGETPTGWRELGENLFDVGWFDLVFLSPPKIDEAIKYWMEAGEWFNVWDKGGTNPIQMPKVTLDQAKNSEGGFRAWANDVMKVPVECFNDTSNPKIGKLTDGRCWKYDESLGTWVGLNPCPGNVCSTQTSTPNAIPTSDSTKTDTTGTNVINPSNQRIPPNMGSKEESDKRIQSVADSLKKLLGGN